MNAITDFPPIEAPVAALAPASIKSAVLAQFADAERTVTALADKYRRVAYDCTTTKGMADAKAARMDLRENGRYAVQRAESRVKTEVNDLKRIMADEVERIVGIVRPVEDAIDQQIKAREEQVAAEKAERERQAAEAARLEAERQQRLEDGITTLASYVQKATGKTAAQMANGIEFVKKIEIDPAHWQEYTERAQQTLAATLETLRTMHAAQVKAEADAAELEALRAEKAAREQREREAVEAAARAEAERLAEEQREHAELEAERIADLEAGAPKPQDDEPAMDFGAGYAVVVPPDAGKDWSAALRGNGDPAPAGVPLIQGEIGAIAGRVNIVTAPAGGSIYDAAVLQSANLSRDDMRPGPIILVRPEPDPLDDAAAFVELVLTAFNTKFPSQPKPSVEWWAQVRQAGEALRARLA